MRITPAHAGTTSGQPFTVYYSEDHPRSRGYYLPLMVYNHNIAGSPPLTRVLPQDELGAVKARRITPAHAGTTWL